MVFSVEPSTSDNGCLTPSMSMPRATTQQDSPKCTPSIISATRSSPDRSAPSSSPSALSVALTNFRDTADFEVDRLVASSCSPTGSSPTP